MVGLRWRAIVMSLGDRLYHLPHRDVQAANGIGQFLGQVLPNIAGDGARALLLRANGVPLAHAAWSVLLDRAVGVYLLFIVALGSLLLGSRLAELGGRDDILVPTVAAIVIGGTLALAFSGAAGRLCERAPRLRFIGTALRETHEALLGPNAALVFGLSLCVHLMTILAGWLTAQALSLSIPLSLADAAVLVSFMVVVTLLPISLGGWGVRELAVAALLTAHGATAEEAVVFSIAYGLVIAVAMIPGALYWMARRGRMGADPKPARPEGRTRLRAAAPFLYRGAPPHDGVPPLPAPARRGPFARALPPGLQRLPKRFSRWT